MQKIKRELLVYKDVLKIFLGVMMHSMKHVDTPVVYMDIEKVKNVKNSSRIN